MGCDIGFRCAKLQSQPGNKIEVPVFGAHIFKDYIPFSDSLLIAIGELL